MELLRKIFSLAQFWEAKDKGGGVDIPNWDYNMPHLRLSKPWEGESKRITTHHYVSNMIPQDLVIKAAFDGGQGCWWKTNLAAFKHLIHIHEEKHAMDRRTR